MIARMPHLQDDTLFDCYYASRRGEALDPPSAEHLADCDACAARYSELGTFLNTLKEDADAEIDALFPPERLHAQQQDIARRLTLIGRAAKVISFPGRAASAMTAKTSRLSTSSTSSIPSTSKLAARWVAAAAAAGLFVGVAAGSVFNFGPRFEFARQGRRAGVTAAARPGMSSPRVSTTGVEKAVDDMDEIFMSDLESVLERPHTSELVAFDAVTPHVREVRDLAR